MSTLRVKIVQRSVVGRGGDDRLSEITLRSVEGEPGEFAGDLTFVMRGRANAEPFQVNEELIMRFTAAPPRGRPA